MEYDVVKGFKASLGELMADKGLSPTGLGRAMGVNMFVVRKWLYDVRDVKLRSLVKIADFFGCSLEYLCGKTDVFLSYEPRPLPPFASHIKTVLRECGKSSYRLLKDTRIAPSQYNEWLHGSTPKLTTLELLAEYLDVTLDFLVGRQETR